MAREVLPEKLVFKAKPARRASAENKVFVALQARMALLGHKESVVQLAHKAYPGKIYFCFDRSDCVYRQIYNDIEIFQNIFCSSLPGLPGAIGAKGDRGLNGGKGEQGRAGTPGHPGERGPQGLIGLTGAKGGRGDQGLRGENGMNGLAGRPGEQGHPVSTILNQKQNQNHKIILNYRHSFIVGSNGTIWITGPSGIPWYVVF